MKQYLLSIYQPDGAPEPDVLAEIRNNLDALNDELRAEGAWVFAGGLHPPDTATVLRAGGEEMLVTDGPFIEAREFLGGFTIITAADLDDALRWGRRLASILAPLAVEVRPFQ
ncbi:YciI family protein [Actinophytocola oryzae]|nr:YciI family protein [Actinophytocola oryzae]